MSIKSTAWVDKYRPKVVSDCFLPSKTKSEIMKMIESEEIPSMLFSGPAGIGKTSTAIALCDQLELEYLLINASLVGIDAVRTDIINFSSTVSFNGKRKVIILDEGDGLTAAAQEALRGVINEFVDNVSFIITANFRNKLIEPLISRLNEVEFLFPRDEIRTLAQDLYRFITERLDEESVEFDKKAVQRFIVEHLQKSTDIRKLLIQAQKIARTGVFNQHSLISIDDSRLENLTNLIKSKDFNAIRMWVGENSDIEMANIVRYIYDNIDKVAKKQSLPVVISLINEYQYKHAFVADKEINTSAMIAELAVTL